MQVQNVKVCRDPKDPACSVLVEFHAVDAAKLAEKTIYKIKCAESNGKSVSVANRSTSIKVSTLQPGTKYTVTVRAENSYRFGKESEAKEITTSMLFVQFTDTVIVFGLCICVYEYDFLKVSEKLGISRFHWIQSHPITQC